MNDAPDAIVIRRLLPFPRERVFAAWLDPASLARWMCPGSVTGATVEVDARVGGRFRIVMHDCDDVEHDGEYLRIEPPSLLSFTWRSINTDHRATEVIVEFHEKAGSTTELILTHRRLPPPKKEAHRQGWTAIVGKLEVALAGSTRVG